MKLLAGKLYDPAVAVNKPTTALLALTALDTTNLRLAFTIPAHGMVRVKMSGVLHGATTMPQILLGVLEGSTVRGRAAPMLGGGNVAATTHMKAEVDFVISGLTPGAVNWDAAYSVDVIVAATGLKYGGPNNATTNDAFGGFAFEIYDPAPAAGAGGGATAQEVWEYATRALTANPGLTAAQVNAEVDTAIADVGLTTTITGRIDAAVSTRLAAAGYTAPANADVAAVKVVTDRMNTALELDGAVYRFTTNALEQAPVGEGGGGITAADVWAHSTRTITENPGLDASGVRTAVGLSSANLDTQLGALPTAAEIRVEMDANSTKLANLDAAITSRLSSAGYTAPDNAGIAAVKAQTDKLRFTSENYVRADACYINGTQVTGVGTAANRWRGLT